MCLNAGSGNCLAVPVRRAYHFVTISCLGTDYIIRLTILTLNIRSNLLLTFHYYSFNQKRIIDLTKFPLEIQNKVENSIDSVWMIKLSVCYFLSLLLFMRDNEKIQYSSHTLHCSSAINEHLVLDKKKKKKKKNWYELYSPQGIENVIILA